MGSLGNWGEHEHNIERDLHTWLQKLWGTQLEVYHLKARLLSTDLKTIEDTWVPVISIQDMLRVIHDHGESHFHRCMFGEEPQTIVRDFWEHAMTQPWGPRHAAAARYPALHPHYAARREQLPLSTHPQHITTRKPDSFARSKSTLSKYPKLTLLLWRSAKLQERVQLRSDFQIRSSNQIFKSNSQIRFSNQIFKAAAEQCT